jgi:preprotein translocase subunit YajC
MFSLFLTAYAEPAAAVPAEQGFAAMLPSLLMLVLMFAVFYFILIRPQKKREKELKAMISSLKVNDEVATIGGIHGKIVRIKDDLFVLESGIGQSKSFITVERNAVNRFLKRGEEEKAAPTPIPGETETEE